MRTVGLLLLGAMLALAGHSLAGWLVDATPRSAGAAARTRDLLPAAALADAAIDSPPFAAFPNKHVPDGTFIEVANGVWFIAPSGFVASRPDTRSLQLSVPGVNIVIAVSDADWLLAHGLKPERDAIEAFAAHNHYQVLSMRAFGAGRTIATLTTSTNGKTEEAVLMMHTQPLLRVSVLVLTFDGRVGDPDVSVLTDEAFHGRLLLP